MTDLIQIETKNKFPISVTEKAVQKIVATINEDEELDETFSVRVSCKGGGCSGILFNLDFDDEVSSDDYQKVFTSDNGTVNVVVDPYSAPYLEGVTVNYVQDGLIGGFKFEGGDKVKKSCGCGKSFSV